MSKISYPLIADGLVFVTVGGQLFALERATGQTAWGPVDLGSSGAWSNATYDAGRVIAVSDEGTLSAFESMTGQPLWHTTLPGSGTYQGSGAVHSAPTAFDGHVYTSSNARDDLFALDSFDGAILWSVQVENGWQSSPALSPLGLFVCYLCNNTYGIDPAHGSQLWYAAGTCTGGGSGTTAVVADGRVLTRGPAGNWILDAASGRQLALLPAGPAPAVAGGVIYAVNDGILYATVDPTEPPLWQFGDGSITTAPIVVGSQVVVGSAYGDLFVIERETGKVAAQAELAAPVAPSNEAVKDAPLTGLAEADGLLAAPAGSVLFAY